MLKSALNALSRLHSREALLKRRGSVDLFSPCRITPTEYFKFLPGLEHTSLHKREFIIPVDSILGQFAQKLTFSSVPDDGTFKLQFGTNTTTALNFDAAAADIQAALRVFTPLANVVVTGSFSLGFTFTFVGFFTTTGLGQVVENTLLGSALAVTATWKQTYTSWEGQIKKGDQLVDGSNQWSIDWIVDLHDLGAQVMAFRVRSD